MKILFVYPGVIVREVPLNVMYVSSAIRQEGHQSQLFHFTPYKSNSITKTTFRLIIEAFEIKMKEFQPDVVAFSVMIQNYLITCELTRIAKIKYNKVTIWGGIQPIIEPEKCFEIKELDYICTGEGEHVFPQFLNCLQKGKDVSKIIGIWLNGNGRIIRNGRPNLLDDLDSIPFPDRDLLENKYYNAELTGANILTARGCPFHCSFCQNKELMNIYRGKGKFVRYRSFENIFKEMELIIERYDAPSFYISDETFTINRERVIEFCQDYKCRINKPFMVQTRIDHLNDKELIKNLSDAGCFMINLAIESGNDLLRNNTLNKRISKEQIFRAFKLAKDHNIMTTSFNMIGVPGETKKTIQETIDINRKVKPDRILCTIFMPLPGTDLGNYCKTKKLLKRPLEETTNYYSQVTIKNVNLSDRTLIGYQGFFDWYVVLPEKWFPLINILRLIYQILVAPYPSKNQFFYILRENIIEFVYQSKKFLPQKKLHIRKR